MVNALDMAIPAGQRRSAYHSERLTPHRCAYGNRVSRQGFQVSHGDMASAPGTVSPARGLSSDTAALFVSCWAPAIFAAQAGERQAGTHRSDTPQDVPWWE